VLAAMPGSAAARIPWRRKFRSKRLWRCTVADRGGPNHFAALHRGGHDCSVAFESERQGFGNWHGLCYQAAVLACLAKDVFTIERRPETCFQRLRQLCLGWLFRTRTFIAAMAPWDFRNLLRSDAILVAAAAPAIPRPLLAQLAEGGRMILPLGGVEHRKLQLIEKAR